MLNNKIRDIQLKVLGSFKKHSGKFALAGGTALELFYLDHRFSKDLDFFSTGYDRKEIKHIVSALSKDLKLDIRLKDESNVLNMAGMVFYDVPVKGEDTPLKIDFVEDVILQKPSVIKFKGIAVYSPESIFWQKIFAVAGTNLQIDTTGREITSGRNEVRDVIDIYYLSKKIKPLSIFLKGLPPTQQRGMVKWYRSFSRHDFKLDFLDFELYDKKLNAVAVIQHLEKEINVFMEGMI